MALGGAILLLGGAGSYLFWSCCRAPEVRQAGTEGTNPPKADTPPIPVPQKQEPAAATKEAAKQTEEKEPASPGPKPNHGSGGGVVVPPAKRVSDSFHGGTLRARLLSTISTKTSKEKDAFTAKVEGGPYDGAVLSGHITRIERKKKQSKIGFQFETITLAPGGKPLPIQADLKDVTNAKGVKGVDEENRIIGSTSKKKAFLVGAVGGAIGGVWGAIKGGGKGAATGAAAGAGAGVVLGLTVMAEGNEVHFVPGTVFTLEATEGRNK
ncbi:hypothetical protein F183_A01720 [Bryobacterales bacterium F-183]|nr:hypothetical protein F183_A01720 [Bryobacterales bacterium F-183]